MCLSAKTGSLATTQGFRLISLRRVTEDEVRRGQEQEGNRNASGARFRGSAEGLSEELLYLQIIYNEISMKKLCIVIMAVLLAAACDDDNVRKSFPIEIEMAYVSNGSATVSGHVDLDLMFEYYYHFGLKYSTDADPAKNGQIINLDGFMLDHHYFTVNFSVLETDTDYYVVPFYGKDEFILYGQIVKCPSSPIVEGDNTLWGICGSFNQWGGSPDIPMYLQGNLLVAYGVTFNGYQNYFKIRYDNSWDENLGVPYETEVGIGSPIGLISNGNNIIIADGTYDIWVNLDYMSICITAPGIAPNF